MSKDSGFAGLDDDYAKIVEDWTKELRAEIPEVQEWWDDLKKNLNVSGRNVANLHWPAGPVSHPRIIAIYRKYFFKVRALNLERDSDAEDAHHGSEELWGDDREAEPERSGPIPENTILLEMLADYATDLSEFFRYFVFIPIGEDKSLDPC